MKLDRILGWLQWINPLRLLRRKPQPRLVSPAEPATGAAPTALVRHQLRVLIVDTDLSYVHGLTQLLESMGHEVQSTMSLNKAYVLTAQWMPHLVVYGSLKHTEQWWFAHAVLGNNKRGLFDPPLANKPYLVRVCDLLDQREVAYSYEFGFEVCDARQLLRANCDRWIRETREMLRDRQRA
jgi:hypothetical protein